MWTQRTDNKFPDKHPSVRKIPQLYNERHPEQEFKKTAMAKVS